MSIMFRGTGIDQDPRFINKQAKLHASINFPSIFKTKVDMKKVSLEAFKPWLAKRVTELLGDEDEVVTDYAYSMLETKVCNHLPL